MIFLLSTLLLIRTTMGDPWSLNSMGIISSGENTCEGRYNNRRLEDFLDRRLKNTFGIEDRGFENVVYDYYDGVGYDPNIEKSACLETEYGNDDVGLSMGEALMSINNLGGWGPQTDVSENVTNVTRYEDVGLLNGNIRVDLVVSIKDGATYKVQNPNRTGLVCGDNGKFFEDESRSPSACEYGADMGQLAMSRNTKTTFKFELVNHKTNDLIDSDDIPGFVFSLFRINGGANNKISENVVVRGWSSAQYDTSNEQAYFSENDPWFCEGQSETNRCLLAVGTHKWCKTDWTEDPFNLSTVDCEEEEPTVNQKSRSFQVTFKNKNTWEVEYYIRGPDAREGKKKHQRVLQFAFNSAHSDDCTGQAAVSRRQLAMGSTGLRTPTKRDLRKAPCTNELCQMYGYHFCQIIGCFPDDRRRLDDVSSWEAASSGPSQVFSSEPSSIPSHAPTYANWFDENCDGLDTRDCLIAYGHHVVGDTGDVRVIDLKKRQDTNNTKHIRDLKENCDLTGYYAWIFVENAPSSGSPHE